MASPTGKTTVLCPACQEPIELQWTLYPTGETAPSAEQPNAEGGTRDAVYDMRLDMGPTRAHLRDAHDTYRKHRTRGTDETPKRGTGP